MMNEAVYLKIFITNTLLVLILSSVRLLMLLDSRHGHVAGAGRNATNSQNLGGIHDHPIVSYTRNPLSDYLCPLAPDGPAAPGIFSGALGPTIQSSIASHSLQLFSAASISASTGAWSGRMKGTISNGSIS